MAERNILDEIVTRRKKDMEAASLEFGFNIPKERQRPVHPFIAQKGVILEVKRASPSKGDIAPDLDSYATAYEYAKAGAKAISCLTETNYFKGTLQDLMNVCSAVDDFEKETGKAGPAVLRKDFLICKEEVEVAYRAGADAVLLIARILTKEVMLEMAKTAETLGISVLIEVRKDEDLEKLEYVMAQVNHNNILCGVNSRDLRDFTIDMLIPAGMLKKIRAIASDARVTFESGILSPNSAEFAASMGFSAILLGEAAAKNPKLANNYITAFEQTSETPNGKFWVNYASSLGNRTKPFIKVCGNTGAQDAVAAVKLGADMLGFIIWPKSKRNVAAETVRKIRNQIQTEMTGKKLPLFVGVIVEPESEEAKQAYELVNDGILDCIQVHTITAAKIFLEKKELRQIPHYCAVNINSIKNISNMDELNKLGEPRILIDAQTANAIGGTGKTISEELLAEAARKYKLWIAGGINESNVQSIIKKYEPEIIDLVSSLEAEPGKKDLKKMKTFFKTV